MQNQKKILPDNFEAVFFDLDGTLIDSLSALKSVLATFLSELGKSYDENQFEAFNGKRIDDIVSELKTRYELEQDLNSLLERYHQLILAEYKVCSAFPTAARILQFCRSTGKKLALVTSAPAKLVNPLLTRLGWQKKFHAIVTGDMVKEPKPSPDLYLLALKVLKLDPEKVIAVEDSTSGVQAAKKAGIFSIGLSDQEDFKKKSGADLVIENLDSFEKMYVESLNLGVSELKPLSDEFQIRLSNKSELDLSPNLFKQVDQIWADACQENVQLFDGEFLMFSSFDKNILTCKKIPYRFFFAQHVEPTLRNELNLLGLAVSGICIVNQKILMAKRADHVAQYPGWYETVPSGGLDESKQNYDGSVSFTNQLLTELSEEVNFTSDLVELVKPLGIVIDYFSNIVDICVELKMRQAILSFELSSMRSKEYDDVFWLNYAEIETFIKSEPLLVPTSKALLHRYQLNCGEFD